MQKTIRQIFSIFSFLTKITILALGIYLVYIAHSFYFNSTETTPHVKIIHKIITYDRMNFSISTLLPIYAEDTHSQTSTVKKDDELVINVRNMRVNAGRLGGAGAWCLLLAIILLFRKNQYFIYLSLFLGIPTFSFMAYIVGYKNEKSDENVMFLQMSALIIGMGVSCIIFGFHHLKFNFRKNSAIHKPNIRRKNVVFSWLHFTPFFAYLIVITQATIIALIAFELELIYSLLFQDRPPSLYITGALLVLCVLYFLIRHKKLIKLDKGLNEKNSYKLAELIAKKQENATELLQRLTPALKVIACRYNLDEIEFYLTNNPSFIVEVLPPNYFDRKVTLRLEIAQADLSQDQFISIISEQIAAYYGSSKPIWDLIWALALPLRKIKHTMGNLVDSGYDLQKEYGTDTYEVTTKYSNGKTKSVHYEERHNLAGAGHLFVVLILCLPIIFGGLIYFIAFIPIGLYKIIYYLSFRKAKILQYASIPDIKV